MIKFLARTWIAAVLVWLPAVAAAPPKPTLFTGVPTSLQGWVPWALRNLGDSTCPGADEARSCLALSKLEVHANQAGATFTITGVRYSTGQIPLPGDSSAWPSEVREGAQPLPTLGDASDNPFVQRPAGPFKITGKLGWRHRPTSITLPADVAVKNLWVDGKIAAWDSENQQMWLEDRLEADDDEPQAVADTVESLQIRVFRLLTDGSPMELTTTLELVVGGKERRITLDSILPADARPLALNSPLAGRLTPRGGLELTLRPGTHQVTVTAALRGTPLQLRAANLPAPWPQEVWSFRERPNLRTLHFEGAPAVDPLQAGLDASYRHDPTWTLDPAHFLRVQTLRRGTSNPDSQNLELQRRIWIDADGNGATVADQYRVQTDHPLRFSLFTPLVAGRILVNGIPQVITSRKPGERGANLAAGIHQVRVLGRLAGPVGKLQLAATGLRLNLANIEVMVPDGWWILHLSGPAGAEAKSTWLQRWTLDDLIWTVLVVGLFWLTGGRLVGAVALGLLVLGHQDRLGLEPWLALGLALAARKALAKIPRWQFLIAASRPATLLVLLCCAWSCLNFTVRQWTQIVHPSAPVQLTPNATPGIFGITWAPANPAPLQAAQADFAGPPQPLPRITLELPGGATEARSASMPPSSPSAVMNSSAMDKLNTSSDGLLGEDVDPNEQSMIDIILAGGNAKPKDVELGGQAGGRARAGKVASVRPGANLGRGSDGFLQTSPDPFLDGVVPTGPALPELAGGAQLNGSTSPPLDAQMRIWTATTFWVRLIRLLSLLCGWALLIHLFRQLKPTAPVATTLPTVPLLLLLSLVAAAPSAAQAYPSEAMLDQLRTTLTQAPECGDNCADISRIRIQTTGQQVRVQVTIETLAKTQVALPRGDWDLTDISCSNCAIGADGEEPWAIVDGIQTISMVAKANGGDLVVSFPVRPRQLEVSSEGWQRQDEGRTSVHLVRAAGQKAQAPEVQTPTSKNLGASPFVRIERRLHFGREWTVLTRLIRASQFSGAIGLAFPVLPGETALDGQTIDSGKARWVLPAGTDAVEFHTQLRHDDTLVLKASEGPWSEFWTVSALNRYDLMVSGLPAVGRGDWEWAPFPGEQVTLSPRAYQAAPGATVTIEKAMFVWTEKGPTGQGELDLQTLVSQATELKLRLPDSIRLGQVTDNGRPLLATKLPDGRWSLPVTSMTTNLHVDWKSELATGLLVRAPRVEVAAEGANFRTVLIGKPDRFTLLAGGEGRGIRMLWWAFLPLFALAIFALVRALGGRLSWIAALSILIPLTTIGGVFGRVELLFIPLLVFVLHWRAKQDPLRWSQMRFQAIQITILLLTALALWAAVRLLLSPLQANPDFWPTGTAGPWIWILDRSAGGLPNAWAFTLPLWVWRVAMGIWALGTIRFALPWVRQGWTNFGTGGKWPATPEEDLEIRPEEIRPSSDDDLL